MLPAIAATEGERRILLADPCAVRAPVRLRATDSDDGQRRRTATGGGRRRQHWRKIAAQVADTRSVACKRFFAAMRG
ncbi:MAG: hypothetical protein AW07_01373 [Candidatus Accumulibacter sp. SK-11]|nr:MAG: hypothetical protein AW07_01373 [Candidatus Accumulibacter sp. SK-11]